MTPVILGRSQRSGNEFDIIEETKRDEIITNRSKSRKKRLKRVAILKDSQKDRKQI